MIPRNTQPGMKELIPEADAPDQRMASVVRRIQDGDSDAEHELLLFFEKRVFAVAYARTHDREAARDISHDVLIAVLEAVRKGSLREPERIYGFVYTIARNVVSDYFGNRLPTEPLDDDTPEPEPSDDLERADRRIIVQRLLEHIKEIDREILSLTLVEGYNSKEVAGRLKLSPEDVRQRKGRALKKILERIGEMSRK